MRKLKIWKNRTKTKYTKKEIMEFRKTCIKELIKYGLIVVNPQYAPIKPNKPKNSKTQTLKPKP